MSSKTIIYTFGLMLIALIPLKYTNANIDTNEVDDVPEYTMIQGVKVYPGDRECVMVGGLCVHTNDCNEPTSSKGLCPTNAYRGVECCYELPMRPAPCEQHMGECMDKCHKTLMRPATDCQRGHVCCVLV